MSLRFFSLSVMLLLLESLELLMHRNTGENHRVVGIAVLLTTYVLRRKLAQSLVLLCNAEPNLDPKHNLLRCYSIRRGIRMSGNKFIVLNKNNKRKYREKRVAMQLT
ncbi:hypothetical protein S245_015723 [Arachis hypogaea]